MNTSKPKILAVWLQLEDRYCGLHLQDIMLPDHCYFLGVLHQNQVILADKNPVLCSEDLVIAIAINPMFAPALLSSLKQHLLIDSWLETTSFHWSDAR